MRNRIIAIWVCIIIVLAACVHILPMHWTHILSVVLIMSIFAASLNIQVGYAGMMALGHGTFFGLGAYSFGLLVVKGELILILAFLLTLIISIIISSIIGFLCLRGNSLSFGLIHLGFNMLIHIIATKWRSLTGGETGITGIERPELFSSTTGFFYLALIISIICLILIRIIINSPFANVMKGLRENEERLRFLGLNTKRFQLVVFIVSSFFAAIAGILYAALNRGVFPTNSAVMRSVEGLMMCLMGGMGTFAGPILGAFIIVIISTVSSNFITQWQGMLGIILVACIIGFRGGILGSRNVNSQDIAMN